MEEIQGVLEKIFRKKGEESYISFKRGQELPVGGVRTTSDVFYLNDFYDFLYEKIESTTSYGEIPPQYFQAEKYYTMGPGIDFPLIMQYSAVEQKSSSAEEQNSRIAEVQQGSRLEAQSPFTVHLLRSTTNYFYFLNGHGDVTYFSDSNFTPEQVESYEYNPWGVLLTSASKNNLLLLSSYYENKINLYYLEKRYFSSILGRYTNRANTKFLNGYFYSASDDLEYFIWLNLSNFDRINFHQLSDTYIKERAWWPVVVVAACVILVVINDCAGHCREACKDSGGVAICTEYPCGICRAECKDGKK